MFRRKKARCLLDYKQTAAERGPERDADAARGSGREKVAALASLHSEMEPLRQEVVRQRLDDPAGVVAKQG